MKWPLCVGLVLMSGAAEAKREPPPMVLRGGLTLALSSWESAGVDPHPITYELGLELWLDPSGPVRLTATGTTDARSSAEATGSLRDAGRTPAHTEVFRLVGRILPGRPDTRVIRFEPTSFSPRAVVWTCEPLPGQPGLTYRCGVANAPLRRSAADQTPAWLYYPSVIGPDGSLHATVRINPTLSRMPEPELRVEPRR